MYYLFANKYYPSNVPRAYICAQNIHKLLKPLRFAELWEKRLVHKTAQPCLYRIKKIKLTIY